MGSALSESAHPAPHGALPQQPAEDALGAGQQAAVLPEAVAALGAMRTRFQLEAGQVLLAVLNLPRCWSKLLGCASDFWLSHCPIAASPLRVGLITPPSGSDSFGREALTSATLWTDVSEISPMSLVKQVEVNASGIQLSLADWTSDGLYIATSVLAADHWLAMWPQEDSVHSYAAAS